MFQFNVPITFFSTNILNDLLLSRLLSVFVISKSM